MQAALPKNEVARLNALNEYRILDTLPGQSYDDITQLAAYICKTPISLISLIDESRQWVKSKAGVEVSEIPREEAFCAHAILQPENILVVRNTLDDPRFSNNPLVTGDPSVRFYAGAPLVTKTGEALGTLCVIDTQPRDLDEQALSALRSLARQVMAQLELDKALVKLQNYQADIARLNLALAEQSITDELTQLKNRRAIQQTLSAEWERAFRYSTPLSLLMIDIDQFKSYNDEFGHPAGDQVLRKIAQLITQWARQSDLAARFGDEEFVIILPETDSDGALQIAERVRYRVELDDWPNRPITISIGVCSYGNQTDAMTMLEQAGQALCRAKYAEGNRVVCAH